MAWYNGGAWGGLPVARMYEILVDIQNKVNDRLDADVYAPIARAFPCAREVKAFAQEVLDVLVAEVARTEPFEWVTEDGGDTAVDMEFLGLDGFSLDGFERPQQTAYWAALRDAIGKFRYKRRAVTGDDILGFCTGRMGISSDASYTPGSYDELLGGLTKTAKFTAEWGEFGDYEAAMDAANAGGLPEDGAWGGGGAPSMTGTRSGMQSLSAGEPVAGRMYFATLISGGTTQRNGLRFGLAGLEDVSKRVFRWAVSGDAVEEVPTSDGDLVDGATTTKTGSETYEITLTGALVRLATQDDMVDSGVIFGEDMNEEWLATADWRVSPQIEGALTCDQITVWQDIGEA